MPNITPAAFRPAHASDRHDSGRPATGGRFSQSFAGVHSSATEGLRPYFSTKRDRTLSLNGKARCESGLLTCNHLSVMWERSFNAGVAGGDGAGKPDYRHFSSTEALQAHAPRDMVELCLRRDLAEVGFVDNAHWGRWLADAFRTMRTTGCSQRSIQVHTPNHSMAMGLRVKSSERGPTCVAKFYDPNRTVTHRRVEASQPEAFAPLGARNFLSTGSIARYHMSPDSGSVVFLGPPLLTTRGNPCRSTTSMRGRCSICCGLDWPPASSGMANCCGNDSSTRTRWPTCWP